MTQPTQKKCPRCSETKPIEAFSSRRVSYCKPCQTAYAKERYHKNPTPSQTPKDKKPAFTNAQIGKMMGMTRLEVAESLERSLDFIAKELEARGIIEPGTKLVERRIIEPKEPKKLGRPRKHPIADEGAKPQ